MKKLLKILISTTTAIIALGGFASVAFAQTLDVHFQNEPNPLFNVGNFLPADEATGVVEVRNLGANPQIVITEAVHVLDPDNLSSQLHLLITKASGGVALYDGSFKTFLIGGETMLSTLSGSGNETYTFVVTFNNINDKSYQGKILSFNLCVGFQGGQTRCGDTAIGGEGDTDDGSVSGTGGTILGAGGGGLSGTRHLIIFKEQTIDVSTTATITWETNLLSTSQVIYGPKITPTYVLDLTLPKFGYPSITAEDSTKVINHSVVLTGLTPGETYVYRVVSRASPPTISFEHEFTVPSGGPGGGLVLGAASYQSDSGGAQSPEGEITGASTATRSNLAAVFGAGWNFLSLWWLWILLILLAAYLFWKFVLKSKNEKN